MGYKYELAVEGSARVVVIVHHDGKRDLYLRPEPDADSEKLLSLTGEEARTLGAVLEGAYFQPVELEDTRVPLGGAVMEWLEVGADSPLSGRTLADAAIRQETGVTVIAVQRGSTTDPSPDPDTVLEPGDTLVVTGTRDQLRDFRARMAPE